MINDDKLKELERLRAGMVPGSGLKGSSSQDQECLDYAIAAMNAVPELIAEIRRLRKVRIEGLNIVPLGPDAASLQEQLSKAEDKLARVRVYAKSWMSTANEKDILEILGEPVVVDTIDWMRKCSSLCSENEALKDKLARVRTRCNDPNILWNEHISEPAKKLKGDLLAILDEPTDSERHEDIEAVRKFKELPCRGRLAMQSLDWYCTEETGLRCKECGKPVCYTCQRFERHRDCEGVGDALD